MNESTTPIIFIGALLASIFILYVILVVRFLLKSSPKSTETSDKKPDGASPKGFPYLASPLSPLGMENLLMHRCVPVQPRSYEELVRSEERLEEGSLVAIPEKTTGKLKFSLQFDSIRATLTVKLHKAQGLPQGDVTYYVILKIMPGLHRSFQSKAVTGSSPEFKEQFEFYVAYENLQHQSLKFTVSSFDRFSQHEVVGELTVHLAELEQRGFNLSREVLLVRFIRAAHKATGALGEVMLSLGYLRLTERLTVVVIRSRDLCSVEGDQPPNPYVEVVLFHAGRKLKEKKTSVVKSNRDAVFNEALTFYIPTGILHQTSLLLHIKHDAEGRVEDKLLGQVFLGPESTGNQFEHWNEMRVSNKPIARWHKLLE